MIMDTSPEGLLSISTAVSMVIGVVLFVLGVSFRTKFTSLVGIYAEDLDKHVPTDVCVDPVSELDFCSRQHDLSEMHLGLWLNTVSGVIIVTGFFIMIHSLVGFISGCRNITSLLFLMIGITCATIAMEAFLIDVVTNPESDFHEKAQEDLRELLAEKYTVANPPPNSITQLLNMIMLQGECCGITGRSDFGSNVSFTRDDGFVYSFQYPPACCRREILKEKKYKAFTFMHGCLEEPREEVSHGDINTEGCYSTLFKHFYIVYGVTAYMILLLLILWHVTNIMFAVIILLRPSSWDSRGRFASRVSLAPKTLSSFSTTRFKDQLLGRRFVPYAKTSSFVSSQLSRQKSTEVW